MTTTAPDRRLRYIDSDGHILEHPTAMPDYTPAEYRDRIWHIETDAEGEEWLHYDGNRLPGEHDGRGRYRRDERRGPRSLVPRRAALHRGASGGVERQGAPAGHGPGRHRPRGAVPHDAPRPAEHARRRLRRGAGARVQRLVLRPHPRRRGSVVRRRRGAADARARRRRARRRRDPPRRRAAGHGVGVHASEPDGRLASVQRPGLRPDLAGRGRHRPPDRAAPVPRSRSPGRVRRAAPEPPA